MTIVKYGRVQVGYYHFLFSNTKNVCCFSIACPDMTGDAVLKTHTHTYFPANQQPRSR